MNTKVFDLNAEYNEQIMPLINAVTRRCEELGIDFFTAFYLAQSEEDVAVVKTSAHLIAGHAPGEMFIGLKMCKGELSPEELIEVGKAALANQLANQQADGA